MNTLYGIKNCDTVKKARRWLDENQVTYQFHDLREDGLQKDQVNAWVSELGWESLVNKRSTTWKQLDDTIKATLDDHSIVEVILASPTLIKRPLLDDGKTRRVGFKAADYESLFLKN